MRYVVGVMLILFLLVGIYLVITGLKNFRLRRRLLTDLKRTEGVVLSVTRKQPPNTIVKKSRYEKRMWMFFPVIRFNTSSGASMTFESESGDTGQTSTYSPGQRLPILYDPENRLPPMIDTRWALWGGAFFQTLGGVAFVSGALLLLVIFGDRIFG
ncbi:MAG TPA: DUF3592 domain-containing protein [Pyrinomonadaceae bacterium]|nr:DUF3592 domain-containing protein [Pyrinomonadaceae bacterium]